MSQVIKDFQSVFEARQAPELMTREMNDARKNMLNNAVAGMKKISTHLQAREGYSDALVVAHTDLGQLYLSVGNENYEDGRENAQIEFEAAMEVCRRWLDAEPENKQAQRRFAEVASRLGRLAWFSDDLDSAIVWIQQAIETAEEMAKSTDEKHRQVAFEKLWNFYFEIGTI